MERWKIVMGVGIAIVLVGGWPAITGTTSTSTFLFSAFMIMVGIGAASYGKKLRDLR